MGFMLNVKFCTRRLKCCFACVWFPRVEFTGCWSRGILGVVDGLGEVWAWPIARRVYCRSRFRPFNVTKGIGNIMQASMH